MNLRGNLCAIITNALLLWVQIGLSVFRRNASQYHIKYFSIIFIYVLSKDFTSNQPQDCQIDIHIEELNIPKKIRSRL